MKARKTKIVIAIEKRLNPDDVFFSKSPCCGDSWFMDKNYLARTIGASWRITHNLKTKKIHLVKYSEGGSSVHSLRFKTTKELFRFINKYFPK